MDHPEQLRRAVLLAIDAGGVAAEATRRIALGNSDPDDDGIVLRRWLGSGMRVVAGPAVTAAQIQRACEALEEFETSLHDLNDDVASPDEQVETSQMWPTRLRELRDESAEIHNEVTAMLALLGRYRTNIVLGRPLLNRSGQ